MADGMLHVQAGDSRTCTACGGTKPICDFPASKGHRSQCKACRSRATVEYQRNNREAYRARQKRWRAANPEATRSYVRTYKACLDPEKKQAKLERGKDRYIERKYGLTRAQWNALYAAQDGVCALCRIPGRTGRHSKLVVDHCHETGRIRGLLCGPCNVALGIFGDTEAALKRVFDYVRGSR